MPNPANSSAIIQPGRLHTRKQASVRRSGCGVLSGYSGFPARIILRCSHLSSNPAPPQAATSLSSFSFAGPVVAVGGTGGFSLPRRLVSIQVTNPQTQVGGKPAPPGGEKRQHTVWHCARRQRKASVRPGLRLSIPVPVWWLQNRVRKRPRGPPGGRAVWRTRPVCPA